MNRHTRHSLKKNNFSSRNSFITLPRLISTTVALAAAAVYVKKQTQQAEKHYPPEGKFIEVDGVRLHYIEKGEGKPLVLLHGNTTMGMDFNLSGLVDMAAQHYRVIVFDRPGYGHSDRPRTTIWNAEKQAKLLHAALQKLGVDRPIVLGQSWGVLPAIALALDFPTSVHSLVLLSGYYYPTMRPDVPFASQPAIPLIGDIMRYTTTPLMLRLTWPFMLKREFKPAPVAESMKAFPVWMALRALQIRASAEEFAFVIPDAIKLSQRYHELKLPIVLVDGSGDRLDYNSRHSDRFYKEIPHAERRIIEGAGHMVHHTAPSQVLEAIHTAAQSEISHFEIPLRSVSRSQQVLR